MPKKKTERVKKKKKTEVVKKPVLRKRKRRTSGSVRREALGKRMNKPMTEDQRKTAFERLDKASLPDFVKEGLKRRFIQMPEATMLEFNSWIGIFKSLLTKTGVARSLDEFMEQEFKRRPHLKNMEPMK